VIYLYILSAAFADVGSVDLNGFVTGCAGKPVMVEILRPQEPGQHPLLLWSGVINNGDGEFSVSIPAQLGDTLLRAAVDVDRNGIGIDDPQTIHPIPLVIGTQTVENVEIVIEPAPQIILAP
jgi:hypothetical protein